MIRSELVARIRAQNPHLYQRDVEDLVGVILDRIAEALAARDRVELRGFGMFSVRERSARPSRNPRTGAAVAVEAKCLIHFRPAKAMQIRLGRQRQHEAEPEALLRAS